MRNITSVNQDKNFLDIGWDTFLFRASSLGYIMKDARGKSNREKYDAAKELWTRKRDEYAELSDKQLDSVKALRIRDTMRSQQDIMDKLKGVLDVPHLSETCKTHLCDLYTVVTTGRTEDIESKYMEKGLAVEEDIITNYSVLKNMYFKKNEVREFNDYIEGENDFMGEQIVYDAKGNWTIFQYNRTKSKPIDHNYEWQLRGYMWLFNKPKARLVYGLINTPEHLIEREIRKLEFNFIGTEEELEQARKEVRFLHTYDDLPLDKKIRTYDVVHSDEHIEKLKQRIKDCRWYLNNFDNASNLFDDEEAED